MAAPEKKKGNTSMGMAENVEGLLCYLGIFITGLIFYFTEKENKFVRFHALQSIFVTIFVFAVVIIEVLIGAILTTTLSFGVIAVWGIIMTIISIGFLALWIFLMVQAYMGKQVKLPLIGAFCEKQANK